MYVCAKCVGGGELAGLCLACSLHCHEGHQLYELYTKRWVSGGVVEEKKTNLVHCLVLWSCQALQM